MKLKYVLKKIKTFDYKNMNDTLKYVADINGKKLCRVKLDFYLNTLLYGMGYVDYMKGNYINLKKDDKKRYLTSNNYKHIINYLNDKDYKIIFHDKILTNKFFAKYVKRNYIDLRTCTSLEFKEFVKNKKDFFAKLYNGFGGKGIEKIETKYIKDYDELYNNLKSKSQYLIEDTIKQHRVLNEINPYAVNNIRIITILKDGDVHIFEKVLRINDGTTNLISSNDLEAILNDDGTLVYQMVDDYLNIYPTHPKTNYDFKKVKIPYMKETLDLVKDAAMLIPDVRLIGWDIAITEDGPEIIEANEYPCFSNYQYYLMHEGKMKYLDRLKKILKDEVKNIKL